MREVKKPEERRAEILAMSKKLFIQKGYMNTTTQDIISALNISRGLLYYHFKSKEDILWYIAEQQTTPLFRRIDGVMQNTNLSPLEKIDKFFEATIATNPEVDTIPEDEVQLLESIQDAMSQPENSYMTDRINHKIAYRVSDQFAQLLKEAKEAGLIQVEHPKEVATYLMTAFTFVMNDHHLHQNDVEKSIQYFNAFADMLNKILNPKEPVLMNLF